jgi:hypothetical protein
MHDRLRGAGKPQSFAWQFMVDASGTAVGRPKIDKKSHVDKQPLTCVFVGEFDHGRETIEDLMIVDTGCGRPRFRTDVTTVLRLIKAM